MTLHLKKCGGDALEELVQISRTTFIAAFEKDNDPDDFKAYMDLAFNREKLRAELHNADTDFYFVYGDEILSGYFKLNRDQAQTDIKVAEAMELERIYVLEAFQGHRIGQWMLERIKEIALEHQKAYLWLGVWEKNVKAISFYEKNGFVKFGTHPYYIGSDEQTDWLMRFDLYS